MRPIIAGGKPSAASGNWFPGEEREPMGQIACEGLAQINDLEYKTQNETAVKKRSMGDIHTYMRMRSSLVRMRSSLVRMRSSLAADEI
jgi:hypothetical protein